MWKILVAAGLLASATAIDDPVHTCVLQRNTAIEQFKLSTLSDLFGEVLTTESDGNIYFVSICRPIPKMFYDVEKLSGAIKISSDGYTTDLGDINESNVVVNENTIVLTYVGGDEDRNPRDPCKGLKWHTYLTFICDPSATKDVLTLIDEDPDQPVICQVWFEIKTSKTCVRHPNIPVEILEKEIIDHRKQIENKKSTEKHEINFNQIPSGYMSHYNRTSKFDNLTHFSNVENKEKNSHNVEYPNSVNEKPSTNNEKEEYDSNKTITKDKSYETKNYYNFRTDKKPVKIENEESRLNRNYSQNASYDYEPFVNEKPNNINEYKYTSYEQNENILNRNDLHTINSLNKSTSNGKNNFDKENKSMNEKIKNDLNEPTSRDYLPNNKNVPASENNKLHYDENENYVKENKSMHSKNDEHISSKYHTAEDKLFFDVKNESNVHKKHFDEENKLNHNRSHNLPSEYGYLKSKNRYWGKEDKPTNDEKKKFNSKKNILKDELLERENSKVIIDEKVLTRNDVEENNNNKQNISQKNNPQERLSRNYTENYIRENHTVNNENKFNNNYSSPINNIRYYDNNNYENEPQESQDESFDMNIYNSKNNTKHNKSNIDSNNETISTITKKLLETNTLNKTFVDSHINKSGKENSGSSKNSDDGLINNNDKSEHNNGTFINQQNINNANKITTSDQSKSESHQSLINSNKNEKKSLDNKVNKNVKPYQSQSKSQYYPASSDTNRKSGGNSNNVNNNIEPEQSKSEKINQNSVTSNENENSDGKSNNANQNIEPEPSKSKESNQNPIDSDKNGNLVDNSNNVNQNMEPEQSKSKESNQNPIDSDKNGNLADNSNNVNQNMEPKQSKSKESNQNSVDSDENGNLADNSNNVNQNMESDQSKSKEFNQNSVDSESKSKPAGTTQKSIFGFDLEAWISKVFPNGFQFSPAIILGGLGSLTAIYAAIATAINRYYYNLSGTDQIPFKGKFQSIYTYIKGFITNICCCGRVFDLESLDTTNEKTPLLKNIKNIFSPTVEDETSHTREERQTNSENGYQQGSDDDGNGGQNNKNTYGSISNDESSSFFGYKEKITNIEKNLLGKSINEGMGESVISKIIPTVKSIYYKLVKSAGKINKEEVKENISKVTSSQFFDEESCINEGAKATNAERFLKDTEGKQLKVDEEQNKKSMTKNTTEVIKSSAVDTPKSQGNLISFLESQDNQNEANKTRDVEKKDVKYTSIILDKPQGVDATSCPVVDILKEVIDSKVIPIANDQVEKLIEKDTKNQSNNYELMSEKHKSVNETKPNELEQQIKEDEKLIITGDTIESSSENIKTKINESKLKFLGLDVEKVDESKIRETDLIDDSSISEESKEKNDGDDSVEVIEEIIYVDELGDNNEEEIIEETIETTTFESSPESMDEFNFDNAHKGHTSTVTVRKTSVRKISSSSGPGEVKTTVETFVSEDLPESEKQKLGLHFGIGISGVNVGLGEKKLKIGTSGVKFEETKEQESAEQEQIAIDFDKTGLKLNRNKKKTSNDTNEEISKSREQKVTVPEKVAKKSKSMKIFKRSTSQLIEPEIQEIENESEATTSKKLSRNASSLLKFGKSRSKSSEILDANKIPTTDVKVMSNFIDQERRSSQSSQLSLTEYDEIGERKSTNTLEGNLVTSITGEIGASTSGLTNLAKGVKKTGSLADLGAASNSNEKLNKRNKSKTKRDIKEKSPPIWKF